MKKILFYLLLSFTTLGLQAQNYKAIYKYTKFTRLGIYMNGLKDTLYMPLKSSGTFEILVNLKYTTFKVLLSTGESMPGIEYEVEDNTAFVDIKNKMYCVEGDTTKKAFSMEELTLVKSKKQNTSNCINYYIKEYPSVIVETCKNIPNQINPLFVIFKNNLYGIKTVKGGTDNCRLDVEFISFEPLGVEVNHKEMFSKFKKKNIKKSQPLIEPLSMLKPN